MTARDRANATSDDQLEGRVLLAILTVDNATTANFSSVMHLRRACLQLGGLRMIATAAVAQETQAYTRSFPRVVDAHCHVHDTRLRDHLGDVLRRAEAANVSHIATCACYEDDWRVLDELLSSGQLHDAGGKDTTTPSVQILPSFGIHPWWAEAKSRDYLSLLRTRLREYPNALLGEIGLCKSARGKQVDLVVQEQVFREQLQLAADLQRGCVIHCVGAHGKLLEILQQQRRANALPPLVILHSYSGPAEMIAAYLALERNPRAADFKVYFSLNAKQLAQAVAAEFSTVSITGKNPVKRSKSEAACAAVPLNALLLETDAPDQTPALGGDNPFQSELLVNHGLNEPALVQLTLQGAAEIRHMQIEELASAVYANACQAFGLKCSPSIRK